MSADRWFSLGFLVLLFLGILGWQEWMLRREDKRYRRRVAELDAAHRAANEVMLDRLQRILDRWDQVRSR